ncbi:PIR Superfamily Protein [Plasmodium ovale curtisi]|uniref:PIR Superfamily Protein n=1 Tax=Plasmodium ovale curtisi TaxID=864141 RepID=A0A1A8X388_PLAOA|nr:PIR Superfamily Protein [Plasmodium ovale curtisi]
MDSLYEEYFSYNEIEEKYDFLKTSHFGKIYKEFNDTKLFVEEGKQYCNDLITKLSIPHNNKELIFNFCNNLYKIIVKVNDLNNSIFDEIDNDDKMYCFSLKYWLYDQLKNTGAMGLKINEHFEEWQKGIKDKINKTYSNPCTFNELEEDQYNKLKSIYAFVLFYYNNINVIHEKKFVLCKYLNYFGKGLKAYYESLSECSKGKRGDNYCKEFNEFQKIYKLNKIFWKNSTYNTGYNYSGDKTYDCPLVIESIQNPILIKYKEKKNILSLCDQPIDSLKGSIISGSSAAGATVGISAFLFYLFKFTNIRSLFGRGKQKDDTVFLNVGEGGHNFAFPISEQEQANFGNSEYNIAYYSAGNS